MDFLTKLKEQAKKDLQTIVLPESLEERNLEAACEVLKDGIAKIILIGKREEIVAAAGNPEVEKAIIIDPATYEKTDAMVELLVELRKRKGMTAESAKELLLTNPLYFGCMLVKMELADGMVSGAIHSTGDVLRPALQILKTAPGVKLASAAFVMEVPNCEFGEGGILVFADTALNQNPSAEEMAHIAITSAKTFEAFVQKEAVVAMLSHSTYGSAKHADVDKVVEATRIAKELAPDLALDGELQLDAAIVAAIGKKKAPESKVAGSANVLVFPDLDAGNIGYKLVQRFANANAYGPVIQGLAKPVNDLSRGCYAADIVGTIALTALQAQMAKNA
jgi:phosphate acetyltransferase